MNPALWLHLAFGAGRPPRPQINKRALAGENLEGLATREQLNHQRDVVITLERVGIHVVPITTPGYPIGHSLAHTPTVLFVDGDPALLTTPGVAVSGSRRASPQGLLFSFACGVAAAQAGRHVVCGLAAGADTAADLGALGGRGRVLGIVPAGILRVAEHKAEGRTLVSATHPRAEWTRDQAMARNKIIAACSDVLYVADCQRRGGTSNQVAQHLALKRPVYLRRGEGEGPYMEELARLAGTSSVPWSSGPVTIAAATPR